MRISILLVIGLIVCLGSVQAWTGFTSVVSRLTDYQTPSGAFRGADGQPNTEATANGLLLASLYGLKVNNTEAAKYIVSVENSDGGYAPAPGAPSDVQAVRDALLSLQHLGGKPSHPSKVVEYLKSIIDTQNHLFAFRAGDKGSIKATALALQSLDLLGELNQKWVQELFPKIKEYLTKQRTSSGDLLFFNFPEDTTQSQVTSNYYAIVVAKYVGFDFADTSKWAKYFTGLQSSAGQFFTSADKKTTSLASTAHAIHALHTLGGIKGEKLIDSVNVDALKAGLRHVADDVSAAAHAHSALALTKAFKDFFRTVVSYEGADADSQYIIEGSNLKPSLSLSSYFNERATFPHGDFKISSSTTFEGKEASKGKLSWDQSLQRYVGEHLPTVGNLGPVKLLFNLVHKVAGLGELAFDLLESKTIGYGLVVAPKVQQDGREIREGEAVSVGTEFKFNVALSTRSNDNLVSGDFVVTFSVVDSSNVIIHQSKVDGASNKGAISFSYTLSTAAIPSGQLSFRFDVAGKGAAHTSRTVGYQYAVPLIATNIQFANVAKGQAPTFKIGDNVKISFEPAAFPDLRTPHVLAHKDAGGADVADKRHFVLDIKSPQGVLLKSVDSTSTKGSSKYTFETTVEPLLESIGTHQLSFRYVPAVGADIHLQNFDSATNELYEDINVLSYTVKADLTLEAKEQPKAGSLFYGSNVLYKFNIKDATSGQYVYAGDKANVFLDLSHDEAGRAYTSVHHPATVQGEGKDKAFNVNWLINPNAVKGAGSLKLSVVDADGVAVPLKGASALKVDIGGDINVAQNIYTTTVTTARTTAFVTEFTLSTKNKTLHDADLTASLVATRDGQDVVLATVPVAHHEGKYTASWTAPHKKAPTGTYKLLFYRNVDRARAQERQEQREKRERKEKQLRGEDTTTTTTTSEVEKVEPLFVIEVPYSAPAIQSIPFRGEFLTVASLGGLLAWLILKRSSLN